MLPMLSLMEIPAHVDQMYAQYKELAKDIYAYVRHSGKNERMPGNTNLFEYAEKRPVFFIEEGVFRLTIDGNMVRFYSENDFVVLSRGPVVNSTLGTDFAADVTVFDEAGFMSDIRGDNHVFEKWMALMALESRIDLFLASAYMRQTVLPDFTLREFNKGDIIIKEGNESRNIFEMVSGSADASKNNRQLGTIHEGEVFGEVSFFTGKRRTATVTALEKCMVRVIHQDNFADMIRHNPNFIISISETLAKRIVHLNQKITNNIEELDIEFEELED